MGDRRNPDSQHSQVTVVVPTYRRARELRRCLDALLAQTIAPSCFEILVVDDAGDLPTRRLVNSYARYFDHGPKIRYLRCPPGAHGPAAARNVGWRAAGSGIIAFTDDDTIPATNWISEGLRAFQPNVMAIWGNVVVPLPDLPTDSQRNTAGLDGAEFVTANCFVRRQALALVGGFDERFTRPWREDSDLYFSLLERDCRVINVPTALVVHPARLQATSACLGQHRNLFFDALLYKKHRRLYRQKIAATPPLRYYLIVAMLLLTVAALLGGQATVAGLAALVWLALTAQLSQQRLRGISRSWREVVDIGLTSVAIPPLAVYWRLAGSLHFRVLFA